MSRIGKKTIPVPADVMITVERQAITAKGVKGELNFIVDDAVFVTLENNSVVVVSRDRSKSGRSKWGMTRTMIENIIYGVKNGFERKLEINGIGYRATMQEKDLQLSLGFSHEVIYRVPCGVVVNVPKPTEIVISGLDRQKVGQVAAEIRRYRAPEPYKGKGIRYADERVVRKEGKKK
ncbi:MAG: large subunit ribosomal protein L6 [Candidatus Tokpelaia sp. JSC085]|nr:MAG: large subunit ribosomal protein L6 [Candidatus Tokpelaia sp. JSC085]